MARIRSIKPEFFRHEGLQDLEAANQGAYPMMVFAGLWGHCDKAGRFEWKPRTLKLDILPFLEFDMAITLAILEDGGFVKSYEVDGKKYGLIQTFSEHQRVSGKEAQEPEKYPAPIEKQKGSNGEATEKHSGEQEGKGREEEREEEGKREKVPPTGDTPVKFSPEDLSVAEQIFEDVKRVAKSAKANLPKWAETIRLMRERDSHSHDEILTTFTWANRDSFWQANILSPDKLRDKWATLEAQMGRKNLARAGPQRPSNKQEQIEAASQAALDEWLSQPSRVIDGEYENA